MPPLDPSKRASWTQLEDEILLEHFDGRTRYQLSTSEQLQFFSLRATAADQRNRAALKSRFEIIRRDAKRANERKAREEAGLSVRLEPQDVELPMADEYEEWWFSLPDDDDDEGDEKLGGGMTEVGESEWGEEARDEGWKINANGEIAIRTGKLRIGAGQVMDPVCMDPGE